jgi:hypothetical protein
MTYFDGKRDASGNMNWKLNDSINPVLKKPIMKIFPMDLFRFHLSKDYSTHIFSRQKALAGSIAIDFMTIQGKKQICLPASFYPIRKKILLKYITILYLIR